MAGMSLGDALLSLAMPFLALGLSTLPDERAVALVFLAGSLPRLAAPLLGSMADRLTPRAAIGVASGLRAAAVLSVAGLALAGMLPYWGLLALAAANALLNVMNARAPLALSGAGGDIHAYVVFEVLVASSILVGITWASRGHHMPQLHRFAVLGAALVALGLLPMLSAAVQAWWAGAVCFGVGLGLVSVAITTRSQQLAPTAERGRTMGALIGLNALGLTLGAALAASALPTPALMLGLALGLGAAAWALKAASN